MNDDVKAAVEWLRGVAGIAERDGASPVGALLAHIDTEPARQKALADRIAELEAERVGHVLVSFSAHDILTRAERDRDALRASWREAVEVAERNAIDCAHLRHSAIALEAERDALFVSHANLAAVLADINEAVGGAVGEEPSLVRAVRALVAERDALLLSICSCSGTCRAPLSKAKP